MKHIQNICKQHAYTFLMKHVLNICKPTIICMNNLALFNRKIYLYQQINISYILANNLFYIKRMLHSHTHTHTHTHSQV